MVATQPVDFRRGMDDLAALVTQTLSFDPFAGNIFVFRAKRLDRIKILVWDGSGLCLGLRIPENSPSDSDFNSPAIPTFIRPGIPRFIRPGSGVCGC
jgi:transposase